METTTLSKEAVTKIVNVLCDASVYCPEEGEAMRVDYFDEDEQCMYGTGEETGEQYCVQFEEINLDKDMFYQLKLMNVS